MDTQPETILKQIDTIIGELHELRRAIVVQAQRPDRNLSEQLYGVLGQGSWNEYDDHLDWQRFPS